MIPYSHFHKNCLFCFWVFVFIYFPFYSFMFFLPHHFILFSFSHFLLLFRPSSTPRSFLSSLSVYTKLPLTYPTFKKQKTTKEKKKKKKKKKSNNEKITSVHFNVFLCFFLSFYFLPKDFSRRLIGGCVMWIGATTVRIIYTKIGQHNRCLALKFSKTQIDCSFGTLDSHKNKVSEIKIS